MDRAQILFYIMIAFILFISLKIYKESDAFQLKCIVSDVDGKRYCVRERAQLEQAADLLARTTEKCTMLVQHLHKTEPNNEITKRLVEGYNPKTIQETLPTSEHTAYSENKGEKIAFCLNTRKGGNKLIDENTLMFVALHELSHVGTVSIGHTPDFWRNFKWILEKATEIKIYRPVDYRKKPMGYCGMTISDNPYYDL
jgi:hypothetical protein